MKEDGSLRERMAARCFPAEQARKHARRRYDLEFRACKRGSASVGYLTLRSRISRIGVTPHRQTHNKPRVAGFRFDVDCAAELLRHNPVNNLKAESGARSLRLGRKECLEDARQHLGWNARAVIRNAHRQPTRACSPVSVQVAISICPSAGDASTALSIRLVHTWLSAEPRV